MLTSTGEYVRCSHIGGIIQILSSWNISLKKKEEQKNSTNKSKCYLAILWCEWLDLS